MSSRQRRSDNPPREWIGGLIQTPFYIEDRDPPYRATAVFWFELPDGVVLGSAMTPPDEATGAVGNALRTALREPAFGSPRRPDRIRVANAALANEVRAVVGSSIPVEVAPTPEMARLLDSLVKSLDDREPGDNRDDSFLGRGDVSPAAVAELFRAAEVLHRVAPWQVATDDQIIRLDIPALGVDGACLTIIGNLGESLGLLIFSSLADYETFGEGAESLMDPGSRPALRDSWLALNFERGADLSDTMRHEVSVHGWPVAAPDAYPVVDRIENDLVRGPLTERDLKIAAAVARSVSTFFVKHRRLFALESDRPACESYFGDDKLEVRLCAPYEAYPEFDIRAPAASAPAQRALPKLGRNDPCHCGSGRKYKRCHLREDQERPIEPPPSAPAPDERGVEGRLVDRLIEYAGDRFGRAWIEHVRAFEDPEEAMVLAVPWTIYDVEIEGDTVVTWFLEEYGRTLSRAERTILMSEQAAWLTVWEATAVEPGASVTFEDLLSGEVRTVTEKTASQLLVARDAVLARIVDLDDGSYLAGLHPRALPPEDAAEVVRLARGRLRRKRAVPVERLRDTGFGRYLIRKWEKSVIAHDRRCEVPPQLTTSDGDPILLTSDLFRIQPGAGPDVATKLAAVDCADSHGDADEGYVFTRAVDDSRSPSTNVIIGHAWLDGDILRLETDSVSRADELRARVESACGDLIAHRIREHVDPRSPAIARDGNVEPPEPTAEMDAFMQDHLRRHYAAWPDHSLPALGGMTPREAARTADGRRELDLVLKSMENREARQRGADGFDFSGLRRELGLT